MLLWLVAESLGSESTVGDEGYKEQMVHMRICVFVLVCIIASVFSPFGSAECISRAHGE